MKKILFSVFMFTLTVIVSQAQGIKSRLMVIPSDDLLKRLNCYSEKTVQGVTVVTRNYEKAFADDIDLRFACAAIAKKFADRAQGFRLENLEDGLKKIKTDAIRKQLQNVQTDPLTQVLNVVRPDVVLELSYKFQKGNVNNQLTFILEAKDSYTTKVLTGIADPGMKTLETDVPTMLAAQVEKNMQKFLDALAEHGADLQDNGRTIRLVVVTDGLNLLEDECEKVGKPYVKQVKDLMRTYRKKGSDTPNPEKETESELEYRDIRIPYIDEETKEGISARDWVDFLLTDLRKICGIKVKNMSQGLGDGQLILSR